MLVAFVGASLLLLVVPGPAVLYIVARSAAQGRAAGVASVVGVHVGTGVHIAAAMVGLSAVLATSATAFTAVRWLGAFYLLWLGVAALRSASRTDGTDAVGEPLPTPNDRRLRRIFLDGVVLNILNPKTAIFFLAFVPQFVDPASTTPTADLALLGGIFVALGLVTDGAYALAASSISQRLQSTEKTTQRTTRAAAATYLGLGTLTILTPTTPNQWNDGSTTRVAPKTQLGRIASRQAKGGGGTIGARTCRRAPARRPAAKTCPLRRCQTRSADLLPDSL